MSATDDALLLEREREVTRLSELLSGAARGRGGVVVIEGPAGIGKTRLLRHARALADGFAVLTASGSELEHDFGFGVVRQLLERAAPARLEDAAALAAPALGLHAGRTTTARPPPELRRAGQGRGVRAGNRRRAALSRPPRRTSPRVPLPTPPRRARPDARFAALHGLYWLVANLAAERPLLLAVDDAQWVDEPSLRFLAYLARRARELPVALVLAARPPLPGEDRSILETIAADAGEPLAPAPLSRAGVARADGAAVRCGAARVRRGVHARDRRERAARRSGPGRAWTSRTPAPSRPPGPSAPAGAIARRLAALGDAAGPLAAAVAVLGDGYELALAAQLAGVELDEARRAAAELAAADVLEDAAAPRFRHPLVRAAVTERLPAVELGRAHARAARLLADREAPPGAIAAHLLLAPPAGEAWVPESLRHAAREARGQGAPELAAAYLRRAARRAAGRPHGGAARARPRRARRRSERGREPPGDGVASDRRPADRTRAGHAALRAGPLARGNDRRPRRTRRVDRGGEGRTERRGGGR